MSRRPDDIEAAREAWEVLQGHTNTRPRTWSIEEHDGTQVLMVHAGGRSWRQGELDYIGQGEAIATILNALPKLLSAARGEE